MPWILGWGLHGGRAHPEPAAVGAASGSAQAVGVTQALNDAGFRAVAIHGDMDQV